MGLLLSRLQAAKRGGGAAARVGRGGAGCQTSPSTKNEDQSRLDARQIDFDNYNIIFDALPRAGFARNRGTE